MVEVVNMGKLLAKESMFCKTEHHGKKATKKATTPQLSLCLVGLFSLFFPYLRKTFRNKS